MLKELLSKVSTGMLWVLFISIALSLLMIAGACTYVVFQSDQVSYDGVLGKFSAKVSNIQIQLNNALEVNEELTGTVDHLKQSLDKLKNICELSAHQAFPGKATEVFTDKFMNINEGLNKQSNLLNQQKTELKAISDDVMQFTNELRVYTGKHHYMKK